MNEAQFWSDVVRKNLLRYDPQADLTRIENAAQLGTPDVNGCVRRTDFWLELKNLERAPTKRTKENPNLIVRIPHYTQSQRLWHRRRGRAGGRTGVLLRIVRPVTEYLYFQWPAAYQELGNVPIDELRSAATVYGRKDFPTEAFVFALMMPAPPYGERVR